MVDIFDNAARSLIMFRVKGKDTEPEMAVRKIAFGLGYRYRLHCAHLPGKPVLVFPRFAKSYLCMAVSGIDMDVRTLLRLLRILNIGCQNSRRIFNGISEILAA